MCRFWKKFNGGHYQSSAKVVDGNLIISLPDAINPIVWRMELGNIKASAMEVRANDNNHLLTLKTPKGEVHDIAPFETREAAVTALMRVSHALEKAEGQMASVSPRNSYIPEHPNGVYKKSNTKKWVWGIVASLAILYVLYALTASVPVNTTAITSGTPSPAQGESGVPLSADEYLRGF